MGFDLNGKSNTEAQSHRGNIQPQQIKKESHRCDSFHNFKVLSLTDNYFTFTLKLSPSTATTTIPAGTLIVALSDVNTSFATT